MVAMLSRVFIVPNITILNVLGLCIVVLGGIVCFCAPVISKRLTGGDGLGLRLKLIGLILAAAGFIMILCERMK